MKQTYFSYFWRGFKIKTSAYAWTCDEQLRIYEEHIRTFKHVQEDLNSYYHALILNSHHGNKKQLGKWIIHSCKIHMVEEETLEGCPKGGGKEELGKEEWVSLNTLSLRKTKIWQDYFISLELKRGEERGGFLCVLEWRREGVYIIVVEKIWMKDHLMRVDKESWT